MSDYIPEIGQSANGAPSGQFEMPPEAEALTMAGLEQIARIYRNRHQRRWDSTMPDPMIPGVTVRSYDWNGESTLPNLMFSGVEIRWYKYPGRGMSCNVEMDGNGWCAWYRRFLGAILESDRSTNP